MRRSNVTADIDAQLVECVQRRNMARLLDNELAVIVLTDRIDGLLDRRAEAAAVSYLRT